MKKNNFRNRIGSYMVGCFLIGGSLLLSCKSQLSKNKYMDESFGNFYIRFHADSSFQMKRIKFPLPGINTDEMKIDDTEYFWKEDNWAMHHDINLDTTDFIVEKKISDSLAIEKIYKENSGFIVERTFKKIDGRWYLVYYKDVNL